MNYILILAYSLHGSVKQRAAHIARGVKSMPGARALTLPKVVAESAGPAKPVPDDGAPCATLQYLEECAGLALGSPTCFGNMAAAMKNFLTLLSEQGKEALRQAARAAAPGFQPLPSPLFAQLDAYNCALHGCCPTLPRLRRRRRNAPPQAADRHQRR